MSKHFWMIIFFLIAISSGVAGTQMVGRGAEWVDDWMLVEEEGADADGSGSGDIEVFLSNTGSYQTGFYYGDDEDSVVITASTSTEGTDVAVNFGVYDVRWPKDSTISSRTTPATISSSPTVPQTTVNWWNELRLVADSSTTSFPPTSSPAWWRQWITTRFTSSYRGTSMMYPLFSSTPSSPDSTQEPRTTTDFFQSLWWRQKEDSESQRRHYYRRASHSTKVGWPLVAGVALGVVAFGLLLFAGRMFWRSQRLRKNQPSSDDVKKVGMLGELDVDRTGHVSTFMISPPNYTSVNLEQTEEIRAAKHAYVIPVQSDTKEAMEKDMPMHIKHV